MLLCINRKSDNRFCLALKILLCFGRRPLYDFKIYIFFNILHSTGFCLKKILYFFQFVYSLHFQQMCISCDPRSTRRIFTFSYFNADFERVRERDLDIFLSFFF